jgi:hypothetical protein
MSVRLQRSRSSLYQHTGLDILGRCPRLPHRPIYALSLKNLLCFPLLAFLSSPCAKSLSLMLDLTSTSSVILHPPIYRDDSGDTDYQTHLAAPHPTFLDIWSKIPTDYFSSSELAICKCLASDYQFGPSFTSATLARPWNPLRRRRWGCGTPSATRSLSVEVPVFTMVFHHVRPWFQPAERHQLAKLHPALQIYVPLRYRANQLLVPTLRQAR